MELWDLMIEKEIVQEKSGREKFGNQADSGWKISYGCRYTCSAWMGYVSAHKKR